MVSLVIIVFDEGPDLAFEIAGQVIVFQQYPVLHGLVPAFDLSLGLWVERRPAGNPALHSRRSLIREVEMRVSMRVLRRPVEPAPQLGHRTRAQRTAGLYFGDLACSERPLPGNCAALPKHGHRLDRCGVANFAAPASGGLVLCGWRLLCKDKMR